MRSASRAVEIRSRRGMVGITPPASRRDRAGWVIPARVARSTWDSAGASRRSRLGRGESQGQPPFAQVLADKQSPLCLGVAFAVLGAAAAVAGQFVVGGVL